jgi:hypothetical protein
MKMKQLAKTLAVLSLLGAALPVTAVQAQTNASPTGSATLPLPGPYQVGLPPQPPFQNPQWSAILPVPYWMQNPAPAPAAGPVAGAQTQAGASSPSNPVYPQAPQPNQPAMQFVPGWGWVPFAAANPNAAQATAPGYFPGYGGAQAQTNSRPAAVTNRQQQPAPGQPRQYYQPAPWGAPGFTPPNGPWNGNWGGMMPAYGNGYQPGYPAPLWQQR